MSIMPMKEFRLRSILELRVDSNEVLDLKVVWQVIIKHLMQHQTIQFLKDVENYFSSSTVEMSPLRFSEGLIKHF